MTLRHTLRTALIIAAIGAVGLAGAAPAAAATAAPTSAQYVQKSDDDKVDVEGGRTVVRIEKGILDAIAKEDIDVKVTDGAKARRDGRFSFKIVDGSVVLKTAAGTIEHEGGLEFSKGDKEIEVSDFIIDTVKGVLTARVNGTDTRVELFKLDTKKTKISFNDDKDILTAESVQLTLTDGASDAINDALDVDLFDGQRVGPATVRANT